MSISAPDFDELDRHTSPNGHAVHDEDDTLPPPPPAPAELFEMVKVIGAKVDLLAKDDEERRDRELRIVTMVQEIHAELFRTKKESNQ